MCVCVPQRIVERFHHNPALPPNSDVAQRLFQLTDTTLIRVTYHLEPNRITASYREFLTPPRGGEQAYNLTFDPLATSGYQVWCMNIVLHVLLRYGVVRVVKVTTC